MSSDPSDDETSDFGDVDELSSDDGESADVSDDTPTAADEFAVDEASDGESSAVVETQTGLDENVAGALSYLLGPVTGILFYLLEDENRFVRFHAAQSTVVFGGLFVLGIGLSIVTTVFAFIPVLGWIFSLVIGLVSLLLFPVAFVAWAYLMYAAYSGKEVEVPVAGKYARQYSAADRTPLESDETQFESDETPPESDETRFESDETR